MNKQNTNKKKTITPVSKPYMTGSMTDSTTVKSALGFLGLWLIAAFMCLIVCMIAMPNNPVLRVVLNGAVEALVLMIFWSTGANKGTDCVARSEIMYQREQSGNTVSDGERQLCFHKLKGLINGVLGTAPLLVIGLLMAFTAQRQMTGAGALPSWLSAYENRPEVHNALLSYTVVPPMTLEDICRTVIRILLMPLVSMIGSENKDGLLLLEKLSPLALLLPAFAYGFGYTRGVLARTRVHTEIAQNIKKRKHRERKERKARVARGPQQLN